PYGRAEAARADHRPFRGRVRDRALALRAFPRARRPTRLPVEYDHDGHAVVRTAVPVRRRDDRDCAAPSAAVAARMTPLEREIREIIESEGPMTVSDYMQLCLTHPRHGYYVTRDPLGARGDFITAPEVSQMFGELIGAWAAAVWRQMGSPETIRLI